MAKLIENTYRQVNIALVNELAVLARDLGVDIWESLHAAATKPFGYQPFWPGPGVGGHCISIDPTYLSWRAGQQLGHRVEFIEHANEVNNRMPDYVVTRVGEALNDAGKPIKGSRVLGIGVAFKPGVDDLRESPSLMVLDRLAGRGAERHLPRPLRAAMSRSAASSAPSVPLDAATVGEPGHAWSLLTAHAGHRRARAREPRGAAGVRHAGHHRRHRRAERRSAVARSWPRLRRPLLDRDRLDVDGLGRQLGSPGAGMLGAWERPRSASPRPSPWSPRRRSCSSPSRVGRAAGVGPSVTKNWLPFVSGPRVRHRQQPCARRTSASGTSR